MMTRAALVEGKPEAGILPTGQNVGLIGELPSVAELVERIIDEAEEVLARLDGGAERVQSKRSAQ
jgi:NAD(P)H-dependent flavin oxidoreductase YrpB (nitropropane dioxygenase family)